MTVLSTVPSKNGTVTSSSLSYFGLSEIVYLGESWVLPRGSGLISVIVNTPQVILMSHQCGETRLSVFTFTFHFHALEKEMATHSSVLAWRIPGTGEPGGLPSMGLHRIGHN